jgi:UDP-glucose 6-dehydrogenase
MPGGEAATLLLALGRLRQRVPPHLRGVDADWHTVREGWLLDPRVSPAHTAAFATAPGFGGKCLPKDLAAIIRAATSAGYHPALLTQILHSNQDFRSKDATRDSPDRTR